MLVNLLKAGKKDIENAIRWQGLELEIEIVVKQPERTVADRDIKKLKEVFEEVSVIERKQPLMWK